MSEPDRIVIITSELMAEIRLLGELICAGEDRRILWEPTVTQWNKVAQLLDAALSLEKGEFADIMLAQTEAHADMLAMRAARAEAAAGAAEKMKAFAARFKASWAKNGAKDRDNG